MATENFEKPYLRVNTTRTSNDKDVKQTMINDILHRLQNRGFSAKKSDQDTSEKQYTYAITPEKSRPQQKMKPEKKAAYDYEFVVQPEMKPEIDNTPEPQKDALDLMLEAVLPNLAAPTPSLSRTKKPEAEIKYQKQKSIDLVFQFDNTPDPRNEYKLKMTAKPTPGGTAYG